MMVVWSQERLVSIIGNTASINGFAAQLRQLSSRDQRLPVAIPGVVAVGVSLVPVPGAPPLALPRPALGLLAPAPLAAPAPAVVMLLRVVVGLVDLVSMRPLLDTAVTICLVTLDMMNVHCPPSKASSRKIIMSSVWSCGIITEVDAGLHSPCDGGVGVGCSHASYDL